jgi:hypothetical protein
MKWLALAVVLATSVAHADRPHGAIINVPRPEAVSPDVSSRIIFVRKCPAGGCNILMGTADDSRTDTSSIAQGDRTIGSYKAGDTVWNAMMQCVRDTYAPFNIMITDVDPGNVPHFEHIVGGVPSDLRNDIPTAAGVASFDCAEIPNAINFTFSDVYGTTPDPNELCWTVAQETAHGFGLEHEYLASDPMTYLTGSLPKRFQAMDAQCGELATRACMCGEVMQNSYKYIVGMFGAGNPTPPTVMIKSPADGKTVQPHFAVQIEATDNTAVDHVELWIDGTMAGMTATMPYIINAPDLDEGPHTVEARAYDVQLTPASVQITVDLGPPCTASSVCQGTDVCVSGQCVPGPSVAGGLGSFCEESHQCLSMQCTTTSDGHMYCTGTCDPSTSGSCPHDFACVANGNSGVCLPSSGGCCDARAAPGGPALLALAVVLVLRRRRYMHAVR